MPKLRGGRNAPARLIGERRKKSSNTVPGLSKAAKSHRPRRSQVHCRRNEFQFKHRAGELRDVVLRALRPREPLWIASDDDSERAFDVFANDGAVPFFTLQDASRGRACAPEQCDRRFGDAFGGMSVAVGFPRRRRRATPSRDFRNC